MWTVRGKKRGDDMDFDLPEELQQQIAAGKAAQDELNAVKQQLEQSNSRFEELAQKMKQLEEAAAAVASNNKAPTEPPAEEDDFLLNPGAALKKVVAPIVMRQLAVEADIALDRVSREFADFGFFKDKIDAMLKDATPEMKANPDFLRNVYHVARSRNLEQLQSTEYRSFVERSGRGGGVVVAPTPVDPASQLDEEELAACKRLGLTPKEYLSYKV